MGLFDLTAWFESESGIGDCSDWGVSESGLFECFGLIGVAVDWMLSRGWFYSSAPHSVLDVSSSDRPADNVSVSVGLVRRETSLSVCCSVLFCLSTAPVLCCLSLSVCLAVSERQALSCPVWLWLACLATSCLAVGLVFAYPVFPALSCSC